MYHICSHNSFFNSHMYILLYDQDILLCVVLKEKRGKVPRGHSLTVSLRKALGNSNSHG